MPHNAQRFLDFGTYLQIELAPQPDNRVTLASERDRFGQPLPSVRWKWDDLTRRSARRAQQILTALFSRSGVGTLNMPEDDPPPIPNPEGVNHHIGTTRMHVDPRHGVVDENCQVHGISNLFVTGSSVFPTGGYANPTLTIVAMAIRLADHVRKVMHSAARVRS